MTINDSTLAASYTKRLYPEIAKVYGVKPMNVERAIRNAVKCAWERGNQDKLREYYGAAARSNGKCPVNAAFISRTKDIVAIKLIESSNICTSNA